MVKLKEALRHYDYLLVLATLAVGIFGVAMVFASIHAESIPAFIQNRHPGLWGRQRTYIITGFFLMIAFSAIDYRIITRFYLYIYGIMMALLVAAMIIGADDYTQTARWLWLTVPGIGRLSMQPSEFAKLFMILFLAKFIDVHKDKFNHVAFLGLIFVLIVVPVFLVYRQPSFSASMVILSISLTILFVGGLYYRTILVGLAIIAPVAGVIWFDLQRADPIILPHFLYDWQILRIKGVIRPETLDPDVIRQTQGSLMAIGNGGLTGRGFMNNSYVIHGHNDFIFSVVAEQFGFVGAALLLAVMAFIIVRCILIALRAQDMQGRLIAAGVAGMLIFETFFHVGVATNLLPNTGVPFPFVSFGGSMIWVHMIAIGIVLNVGLPRAKSMFDDEEEEL